MRRRSGNGPSPFGCARTPAPPGREPHHGRQGAAGAARCQPSHGSPTIDWSEHAAVDPGELEPGDHLLRWGPEDSGARRFCHHTSEPELDRLVGGLPLAEVTRYRADGPGGRQNLYWLGTREGAA